MNNTDAEGRLTLADALIFAQKQGVTSVVDIATLTGACMIALGTGVAGLFTPSDELAGALQAAAGSAGEKIWRMPLEESYWDQMTSPIGAGAGRLRGWSNALSEPPAGCLDAGPSLTALSAAPPRPSAPQLT